MAGRYIINQTAGKRVVILDEDTDNVTGGYFDTEGNWHELSEPGLTFNAKDKTYRGGNGTSASGDYFDTANHKRLGSRFIYSCAGADSIEWKIDPDLQVSIEFLSSAALAQYAAHSNISAANRTASGWVDGNKVSIPEIGGEKCYFFRWTVRSGEDESDIDVTDLETFEITLR